MRSPNHKASLIIKMTVSPNSVSYAVAPVQISILFWHGSSSIYPVTSQTLPVKYTGTKFLPKQHVSAWLFISQVPGTEANSSLELSNLDTLCCCPGLCILEEVSIMDVVFLKLVLFVFHPEAYEAAPKL